MSVAPSGRIVTVSAVLLHDCDSRYCTTTCLDQYLSASDEALCPPYCSILQPCCQWNVISSQDSKSIFMLLVHCALLLKISHGKNRRVDWNQHNADAQQLPAGQSLSVEALSPDPVQHYQVWTCKQLVGTSRSNLSPSFRAQMRILICSTQNFYPIYMESRGTTRFMLGQLFRLSQQSVPGPTSQGSMI